MYSFTRGNSGYIYYDEDDDDGYLRHETLESRATFRILEPKKKGRRGFKAALTRSNSTSEAETSFEVADECPVELRQITETNTTPARASDNKERYGKSASRNSVAYFDSDPTPTQSRSIFEIEPFPALGECTSKEILKSPDVEQCDRPTSSQTQEAIETAMSHIQQVLETREASLGDDAFDSLDWDPDLPSVTPSESPEPVAVKPKPVAYTTVGSLVDPNVRPQFAPPKRIQREGANRAPLLTMLQQGTRFDPYYSPRCPPPSLNRANSMAYAQRIGRSPGPTHSTDASSTSLSSHSLLQPLKEPLQLTDEERNVVMNARLLKDAQAMPANLRISPNTPTPSSVTRLSAVAPPFSSSESLRSNPLDLFQELRKNTEATKMSRFGSGVDRFPLFCNRSPSPKFRISPRKSKHKLSGGELDLTYQFPPGGANIPSTSQANPLFGAYGNPTTAAPDRRPGYPQPLTAGPPGQRQRPSATSRASTYQMETIWANGQPNTTHDAFNAETRSPWTNQSFYYGNNTYTSGYSHLPTPQYVKSIPYAAAPSNTNPSAPSRVIDTLTPHAVSKYYPQGVPGNLTGAYTPLSDKTQKEMNRLNATADEKEKNKVDDQNECFYSGQRRFATMETEDYITELEAIAAPVNRYGPISPPKKTAGSGPVVNKPFTVEEMNTMPLDKVMRPIMNTAFGTMLSYATEGFNSRKTLSGWVAADPDKLDITPEGNGSLFGEDWGAPPAAW